MFPRNHTPDLSYLKRQSNHSATSAVFVVLGRTNKECRTVLVLLTILALATWVLGRLPSLFWWLHTNCVLWQVERDWASRVKTWYLGDPRDITLSYQRWCNSRSQDEEGVRMVPECRVAIIPSPREDIALCHKEKLACVGSSLGKTCCIDVICSSDREKGSIVHPLHNTMSDTWMKCLYFQTVLSATSWFPLNPIQKNLTW